MVVSGSLHKTGNEPGTVNRVLGAYALVAVTAGGGSFTDGAGASSDVSAGDVLVLFPDVPHSYGPEVGGTWSESYVVFEGAVFDLWRSTGLLDPGAPVVRAPGDPGWWRLVESLVARPSSSSTPSVLDEVCTLQEVLARLLQPRQGPPDDADAAWLARAEQLLRQDLRRDRDIAWVAQQMSMSYDGFRKHFRRAAGISPGRYRTLVALDRACELMATTQMTDRQIAAELGFSDEFHFSHRFSAVIGRSPRSFRRALPR